MSSSALGSGIPAYQYAGDDSVLSTRLAAIEAALRTPPRKPGVGDWVLDMNAAGALVAVNLRTNIAYPVTLGAGVKLPST